MSNQYSFSIMIATTNLQQNMDKAFERRFLYKIKFDKPTEEARASIWRSMIPDLSELDIHILASKYDLVEARLKTSRVIMPSTPSCMAKARTHYRCSSVTAITSAWMRRA